MAHFITESCIGCTLCAKRCPVGAISGELKKRHVINPVRCVDCGVCGRGCKPGAVVDQNGEPVAEVPKKEWSAPVVNNDLCTACSMCVSLCGKDALEISMPQFKGDHHVFAYLARPASCVGCSMCEDICPMHAITMKKGEEQK